MPAGTGLGSSSSLTVGLLNALFAYKGEVASPGKLADLVILSDNPLEVDPMQLKDVQVLETIKAGRRVYRRR